MSDHVEDLAYAREVLSTEARAIESARDLLGPEFTEAIDVLAACEGQVVVTGVGKSGIVGRKISATLASTGTPSFFLHTAEAFHGDLGRIREKDVVLALSYSGETDEVLRLIPLLRRIGAPLVAVTGHEKSRLGREADVTLSIGPVAEACPFGLAPSSSTTATMAVGDALALTVSRRRGFKREDYALFHRGGSLARKLLRVEEIMRTGELLSTVTPTASVRETLPRISGAGGRKAGAALVVDAEGLLLGIFTDGDLRRHLQQGVGFLDDPISRSMTADPKSVRADMLVAEAQKLMESHKIDEVPVVDAKGRLVGILDVQDLLEVGFAL